MSTRSEIQFEERGEFTNRETGKVHKYLYNNRIYRHSDGYPEGVVRDLWLFLHSELGAGRREDVEYFCANYIYWEKTNYVANYGKDNPQIAQIGFGIQNAKKEWLKPHHGDIEFTYLLTLDKDVNKVNIQVCKVGWKKEKPKIIFNGTLKAAFSKYCPEAKEPKEKVLENASKN